MHCYSFPPIARPDARVLILGTMPGKRSLHAQQYYSHAQNAFWHIVAEILGFDVKRRYADRVSALMNHQVAVWDVLQSCTRESSLDSDIDPATIIPNDFTGFLAAHARIQRVCFNGTTAGTLFTRHVQPHLPDAMRIEYLQLPSTSPANARVSRADKLHAWREIALER